MFKRILIAGTFVGALAVAGLGVSSSAQAGHPHCHDDFRRGGFAYGAYYGAYPPGFAYRGSPHPRSVYYYGDRHRLGHHGLSYKGPAYRSYRRGPAFRLSIGF